MAVKLNKTYNSHVLLVLSLKHLLPYKKNYTAVSYNNENKLILKIYNLLNLVKQKKHQCRNHEFQESQLSQIRQIVDLTGRTCRS